MKAFSLRVIALASLPAFGACADTATNEPTGPGFAVTVAPLQLTNIGDACYSITVEGAAGTVVDLPSVCASQYGNEAGGDITYIAPCDASAGADVDADNPEADPPYTGATGVQNTVTIKPTLYDGVFGEAGTAAIPAGSWRNPCDTDPDTAGIEGCELTAECKPNSDTLIEFNLTIMRDAQQGFFDVAVNFADIFCSAKVDCQYANGDYIRLVHGDNGQRTATAVVAFACTDGNFGDTNTTRLYASNVVVTCDGGTYLVPTGAVGNVYTSNPSGPVEQAIVFMGNEQLQSGGQDANKIYWNTAIGFDEAETSTTLAPVLTDTNCSLSFTATASQGALSLTGAGFLSHPFMTATVGLTNEDGDLTCGQHPLNSDDFAVVYDDVVPESIVRWLDGTGATNGAATNR